MTGRSGRVLRIPLVRSNLVHDRRRTAVGVLGVAFAAILMLMQLGFLGAVRNTATTILDKLDFDILLVSPTYLYFYDTGSFPRIRLDQARSVAGVDDAVPLYVGFNNWSRQGSTAGPAADAEAAQRAIFILGFRLSDRPFRASKADELRMRALPASGRGACRPVLGPDDLEVLKQPDTLLIDRFSHPDFGPQEELDPCHEGARADRPSGGAGRVVVGSRRVRVVGGFDLAIGFGADGAMIVGDQNFGRLFGGRPLDGVSLGLVRTTADPGRVASDLERYLPGEDVRVLTRAEILAQETAYWVREKPVGVIFGLGIVVACAVGMVFVYQILSSDITKRFGEFATLKAMGYPDRTVSSLVIRQAIVLAHAGFVPGVAVAAVLDRLVEAATHLPVELTWPDVAAVYAASVAICTASAFLSVGKVRRADPADLFA